MARHHHQHLHILVRPRGRYQTGWKGSPAVMFILITCILCANKVHGWRSISIPNRLIQRASSSCPPVVVVANKEHCFLPPLEMRRRSNYDYEDDYDYYYDEEDDPEREDDFDDFEDEDDDDYYYYDDEDDKKARKSGSGGGGFYNVRFEDRQYKPADLEIEWEECWSDYPNERDDDEDGKRPTSCSVLLPPLSLTKGRLPTVVVHFVGGTFFGSAPKMWYRSLLEDLVRHTQCAVVVSSIPVTFRDPLNHVKLTKQNLQPQLNLAFEQILVDEYGEDVLKVPLVGLGHSLGSRLLMVLATLQQGRPPASTRSPPTTQRNRRRRQEEEEEEGRIHPLLPDYESLILISFANYGAPSGIPGLGALLKESRKAERRAQESSSSSRSRTTRGRQSASSSRRRRRRRNWDDYDDDDEYDLTSVWEDLQTAFQETALDVKTALTPASKDLEVYPSPDQLWKALEKDNARYKINKTLLVQFDDDEIDQSSQLATRLQKCFLKKEQENQESSTTTNTTHHHQQQIHFARLRGNHLTPLSSSSSNSNNNNREENQWLQQIPVSASKALMKLIRTSNGSKSPMGRPSDGDEALRDLRQSITRYITDVVTK